MATIDHAKDILKECIGKTIKGIRAHKRDYSLVIEFTDNSIVDLYCMGDDMSYIEISSEDGSKGHRSKDYEEISFPKQE